MAFTNCDIRRHLYHLRWNDANVPGLPTQESGLAKHALKSRIITPSPSICAPVGWHVDCLGPIA